MFVLKTTRASSVTGLAARLLVRSPPTAARCRTLLPPLPPWQLLHQWPHRHLRSRAWSRSSTWIASTAPRSVHWTRSLMGIPIAVSCNTIHTRMDVTKGGLCRRRVVAARRAGIGARRVSQWQSGAASSAEWLDYCGLVRGAKAWRHALLSRQGGGRTVSRDGAHPGTHSAWKIRHGRLPHVWRQGAQAHPRDVRRRRARREGVCG